MKATIFTVLLLLGEAAIAAPDCTRSPGQIDDRRATAAGCFIKQTGKLLLVRQRINGKLGFPAGFSRLDEQAQCTAHRETWEETGLQVEVGQLVQQFGNGFLLYRCKLLMGQTLSEPVTIPKRARREIAEILWVDPHDVPNYEWRFSWQVPEVLRLFDQLP